VAEEAARRLTTLLGVDLAVIGAPMGGGPTTPELVAAVSNAGGLGSFAGAYLTPEQIRDGAAAVRARTDRPFAVNLFAGGIETRSVDPEPMLALLAPLHERYGIPPPQAPSPVADSFGAQLEAAFATGAPVLSFTFGLPGDAAIARLRAAGRIVIGTATTLGEALRCEAAGCDAIVVQGAEAGGHRGTFLVPFASAMVGTAALVPQVVDRIRVPVIAAGGIVDRRGVAAVRALGASGVQCGTAFLDTVEAGTTVAHRHALAAATEDETVVTRAFTGRPARVLSNALQRALDAHPEAILPFPLQSMVTRPLRTAAAKEQDAEYLALLAGQGAPLMRHQARAAEIVAELAAGFACDQPSTSSG
jgi:nitronate monooxygenase